MGWLDIPDILSLRYEDFTNNRRNTLFRIINHAVNNGFQLRIPVEEAVVHLDKAIDPVRSPTFRSGKIGKWKDNFNDEHTKVFKEVCGDILISLGYEDSDDW
jgi:hypothetical protein